MEAKDSMVALLQAWIKELAREAFQESARDYMIPPSSKDDASTKLREQLALIKSKERVTVKEAALLLSCSESHVRKLVRLAHKGKSRRPIPFVDMEGVTVFPLRDLLGWASPQQQPQGNQDKNVIRKKAA
ncbi:MAG: hypothetical protein ABR577_14850 [Pyrinomonadaceae bacterium]